MNTVLKFEEWAINERMGEDDRVANKIRLKVRKQFEEFFEIEKEVFKNPWDWWFYVAIKTETAVLQLTIYATSNYRITIDISAFGMEEFTHRLIFNLEDALSINLIEEIISDLIIEDKENALRIIETAVGEKTIENIRFKIRGKKIGVKTGIV